MSATPPSAPPAPPGRRGFVAGMLAMFLGGLTLLTPVASATLALLDPLRRKRTAPGNKVKVTSARLAEQLKPGVPECFVLTGTRSDAWNTLPNETIGTIFLVRNPEGQLTAFQAICPHQGCDVSYLPAECRFFCPCHKANFQADGSRVKGDSGPVCRDLDALEVEVRDGEVWVDYKKFRTGLDRKEEA